MDCCNLFFIALEIDLINRSIDLYIGFMLFHYTATPYKDFRRNKTKTSRSSPNDHFATNCNIFFETVEVRFSLLSIRPIINPIYIEKEPMTHRTMINFSEIDESVMRCIIQKSATKSCDLDPIPTICIKQHLSVLLPLITRAVNMSITMGKFPDNLKEAILHPLLKKLGLECIPQNYRPVSNLPYLGKLIERCVSNQLVHHTESTGNVKPFQSA